MPEEKQNPFIENLKRFNGRQVDVHVYVNGESKIFTGKCEAIDFQHKGIIIKNEHADKTETTFIPRYYKLVRSRGAE